ncbi:ATP-binding cassette domain-containing protein [Corallococcus sp. AB018]|uniref:AAA family ATPase n=1 Tax=unclassified Corallococcus TaxID=2685029 RepID=UPI000EA0797F|nr:MULTISPECIES: AAA family ATPase [unclassified Corallococcus]RKH26843.1 ATP-binding cassette domain-containing protein [Corallococcus sp. CA041A]RUO92491.1 ATP-binding cassette domain-containing protein [Corallococcus sp. AB018]
MLITEVKLPEDYEGKGMGRTNMNRLGSVVVLAGPNGGGKSRLLQSIFRAVVNQPTPMQLSDLQDQVRGQRKQLEQLRSARMAMSREDNFVQIQHQIQGVEQWLQVYEDTMALAGMIALKHSRDDRPVYYYVPRPVELVDPSTKIRRDALAAAEEVRNGVGFESLKDGCLAYIGNVQDRWFQATHPQVTIKESEKAKAVEDYQRLCDDIKNLLGAQLDRSLDGAPTLWGRAIPTAGLSEGQRLLLQLSVALHAQGMRLSEAVLLLDEPETHLHPAAVVDVLETLRKATPDGQLWIATHSLSILAWAPTDSLWFVRGGHAKWVGREPELVLTGLLGDEQGRERLEAFLQLPAQLASNRFAADCLLPPTVVMTDGDDPQLQQIRNAIHAFRRPSQPLRLLDFGAGKGRLLAALREAHDDGRPFTEVVDYRALDASVNDRDHCIALINATYGMGASAVRHFRGDADLESQLDVESIDVAIMCNVLHEVPPSQWLSVLGPKSALARRMRPSGFLLIVEDMHIPVGEKAHSHGFLLLDTYPLKGLFGWREADPAIQLVAERDGRLKAWLVPASLLKRVSPETRSDALLRLQTYARKELQALRQQPPSFRNGQLHGLWTQLFANASLAIDDFGGRIEHG